MNFQKYNYLTRIALAQRLYSKKSNTNNKKNLMKEFKFNEFDFIKFKNLHIKKSRSLNCISEYYNISSLNF